MRPELIRIGEFVIHGYPAMLALAFLVCTLLAVREGLRMSPPVFISPRGGVWVFLGALIGAKAFWILQFASIKDLWRAVFIWEPGMVFYGGFIGGAIAATVYLRWAHVPLVRGLDIAAPYLALGEAITRVGCFLNGCCWGRLCAVPWGVEFPRGSHAHQKHIQDELLTLSDPHSLPVHPTQLYMVLGLIPVFIILKWLLPRTQPGTTALLYLAGYGLVRFTVEAFRGDSARALAAMTVSQLISLGMLCAGMAGLAALWRRRRIAAASASDHAPEPAQ